MRGPLHISGDHTSLTNVTLLDKFLQDYLWSPFLSRRPQFPLIICWLFDITSASPPCVYVREKVNCIYRLEWVSNFLYTSSFSKAIPRAFIICRRFSWPISQTQLVSTSRRLCPACVDMDPSSCQITLNSMKNARTAIIIHADSTYSHDLQSHFLPLTVAQAPQPASLSAFRLKLTQ